VIVRTKISLVLIAVGSVFWFLNVPQARFEIADKFSYEIDGKPHDLGEESRICNILEKKHGEVRISILVTPNALRNWQNVFQTSDVNAGIRLEINENGLFGVIVSDGTPAQFLGVGPSSLLTIGKQSSISIIIAHDSGITISVDGKGGSGVTGVVKPKCDRLRIGVGFDDTRGFDGTGSITFETGLNRKPFPILQNVKTFGQILLVLGSIMWAGRKLNLTIITKQHYSKLIAYASALIGAIIGMTPLNRGRFYGDDFQTIQSITTPGGYGNSFLDSLALTGLDKWRPFFSSGIGPIYRLLGENYSNFQIFSTILLSFVGYLSYSLIQELFSSKITGFENVYAFILPALIASSRFTWMARGSVFGYLELPPVILALIATKLLVRGIRANSRITLLYSAICLLAASLFHERFIILTFAFAFAVSIYAIRSVHLRGVFLIFLSIPLFHWYTKAIAMNIDPVRGGGEQSLRQIEIGWAIRHYVVALLAPFNWPTGETFFFDGNNLSLENTFYKHPQDTSLYLLLMFVVLLVLTFILHNQLKSRYRKEMIPLLRRRSNLAFIAIILFSSIPAATVAPRLEMRWIYFTEILLVVALVYTIIGLSRLLDKSTLVRSLLIIPLVIYASTNIYSKQFVKYFDWPRIQGQSIYEEIAKSAPIDGEWGIAFKLDEANSNDLVGWQIGYGAMLENLDNPPISLIYYSESCDTRRCLIVRVSGVNEAFRVNSSWKLTRPG